MVILWFRTSGKVVPIGPTVSSSISNKSSLQFTYLEWPWVSAPYLFAPPPHVVSPARFTSYVLYWLSYLSSQVLRYFHRLKYLWNSVILNSLKKVRLICLHLPHLHVVDLISFPSYILFGLSVSSVHLMHLVNNKIIKEVKKQNFLQIVLFNLWVTSMLQCLGEHTGSSYRLRA